jgi:hypothetical protein
MKIDREARMNISIHLTAEPENGGDPLIITTTRDRKAIAEVAAAAVREARDKTNELAAEDPVLGQLQAAEAERLYRALELTGCFSNGGVELGVC